MTTLDPFEHAYQLLTGSSGWATPGDLAKAITPATVQTPALDLIDQALVDLADTPDGRLIVTMPPQEGKALSLGTMVPTPTGWTTMGELRVGDEVFGGDGRPCRVTWVSPTWTDRDCYEVTTGDGERIVADAAHEWVAQLTRTGPRRIYETTDLARARSKNARITGPAPLELPEADLPLDPYVLGVWLGDGTTDGAYITSHLDDVEVRDRCAEAGWPLRKVNGSYRWAMAPEGWQKQTSKPSPARLALQAAGVWRNKHIPDAYLRASREQRLALLQGLIDTDGYVTPKGQVEFCSTVPALAEGVRELVYSLGAKAVMGVGRATINGKDCGPKYRVRFYLAHAAHMTRKAKRCKDSSVARVRYVKATPTASVPTRCIEVDSPDHTFLAGRTMLPTHNSTRVAIEFVVWWLTQHPDDPIVVASYGQALAVRNGRAIRRRIEGNQHLHGLTVAPDNGAVHDWTLGGHTGGVLSVGIGTGLTGRPARLMVIDDPIKDRTEADSETYRQRVWDWWTDVASTRLAPGAPVVVILTRWHDDDLAGRLLAAEDGHLWRVLNIPAQADTDDDPLGREIGEYMQSARGRTAEQWAAIRVRSGARTWASLYQGRPSPASGDILQRDWWRLYDRPMWIERPDGTRFAPLAQGTNGMRMLQSWDMAFKGTASSDWVVGQVWMSDGVSAWLLDQARGRWSFVETMREVVKLSARWPQAILKLVEDKANGPAVISALSRRLPGLVAEEPHGSKTARASAIAPLVEAGNVHLPSPDVPGCAWVGDLIEEAAAFPAGAHDDQVDAASQALNRLLLTPILTQPDRLVTMRDLDRDIADYSISAW